MPTLNKFVNEVTDFIGTAVANLFLTLAVVVFFWAVINFIMKRAQGASDGMKQARDMLGWSIVGLFVMFSIWGIVFFFQDAFKIQNQNSISAPSIKVNTSNGTAGASQATAGNRTVTNGTKTEGMSCTPMPGDSSECRAGLYCNNVTRTCVNIGTDSSSGVARNGPGQRCSGVGSCIQGYTCGRNNVCVVSN